MELNVYFYIVFLILYVRGINEMKSIYDIQQFLKQFGTIIYIGDRIADLELMESELRELYQAQLIDPKEYSTALLILRQEIRFLSEKVEKDR
jgi:uncharacterized protein YqgQ